MGGRTTTTFATSDHGFGAQWLAVNAGKVLFDAGLQNSGGRRQRSLQQLPRGDGNWRGQPGQGLLGRRHGADLRQHDAAGRDDL